MVAHALQAQLEVQGRGFASPGSLAASSHSWANVKLLCGTSFSAVLQCKTKSIVVEGMSEVLQQPQLGKGEAAVRHQLQRSPAAQK
jgi:hypothetical protein